MTTRDNAPPPEGWQPHPASKRADSIAEAVVNAIADANLLATIDTAGLRAVIEDEAHLVRGDE